MAPGPTPRFRLLLIVIDGWGLAPPGPHNAIRLANPTTMDRLAQTYPYTTLEASGTAVGLPEGQMGNSEVGHLNIGAGRVVDQDIVRISKTCKEGRMGGVPAVRDLFEYCGTQSKPLHLVGLLGPGGVHSHEDHLLALLSAAEAAGVEKVWIHHVLDGRDTPPQSAVDFARRIQPEVDRHPNARVATVSGRYWTMDRDKRWERTERAYRVLTELVGHRAPDAAAAIESAYARSETDEFVTPVVVGHPDPVRSGDALLVYNFRPDRARQIVRALGDPQFDQFPTLRPGPRLVSMTQYDQTFAAFDVQIAFPPSHPQETLGEYYARLGLSQLRLAETEKYAHVTYFFSGGRETPFEREERILVPSPKIATYDLEPAMSAPGLVKQLLDRIRAGPPDLVVLNFANPDMVGHTGRLGPTVEACRVVDDAIRQIVDVAPARGYLVAVTADHGNAESMVDAKGRPLTAHTTNPVPFVLVHPSLSGRRLEAGRLADVAPTLLDAVGLPLPSGMTGRSLLSGTT